MLDEASQYRQAIRMALEALGRTPFTDTEKEVADILNRALFGVPLYDVERALTPPAEKVA